MNILLVQPPKAPKTIGGEDVFIFEPLALEYLASAVASHHDVRILDLRIDRNFESVFAGFDPDVVGITAYTVHVNVVRELFRKIKAWKPETLTVVGGHHATVKYEDFLIPSIDMIVVGEGVFPFKEIVERHEQGKRLSGIPGTIAFCEGQMTPTLGNGEIDLDAFPHPERKLTAAYRGNYFSEWMKPLASVRTSKGCPYRCTFCAEWKIAQGRYLKRKPEQVLEELSEIAEPFVFFADDESLVDGARMFSLAKLIKDAGIKKRYFLYGRSDTIAKHPDLIEEWRNIGLERVFIGLEFFRDADLAFIRKNATSQENDRAVRILNDLGIEVYGSFIVRPEFTKEDFSDFREYCRHRRIGFASFAVLTPLPGTDLYQEAARDLIVRDYDYFDFIHTLLPTRLPLEEFYAEYRRLFMEAVPLHRQLYALGKYRLRDIPEILRKGRAFYGRLKSAYLDYEVKQFTEASLS